MTRCRAAHPSSAARPTGSLLANRPLLLVSGATTTVQRLLGHPHLGRLVQPRNGNLITDLAQCGAPWAADNDALNGLNPDRYLTMCDQIAANDTTRLLFVTAPDAAEMTASGPRVSWEGTLWLWRSWRRALVTRGLPAAIVAQDGADEATVPWSEIAALFIGGSDAYKDGPDCARLILAAKARQKWVHVGRVNSQRREDLFLPLGVDSFDGGQYSMFPDTYIPACLARLSAGQQALEGLWT